MDRRGFIRKAGVGGRRGAGFGVARHRPIAPELKWRMTSSFPKALDTIYGAAETFAKYVAEATDDKFQIQVFAAGEIVPGLEAANAVSSRHRRDVPYRVLLLLGQGSDLSPSAPACPSA